MRTLSFCSRTGTFKLYDHPGLGRDIGEYVEVEFIRDLGITDFFEGSRGPVPVTGYEVLLKFCNTDMPEEIVTFKSAGWLSAVPLMEGRQPGETLIMRPYFRQHRVYSWYQLVINDQTLGLLGARIKAK